MEVERIAANVARRMADLPPIDALFTVLATLTGVGFAIVAFRRPAYAIAGLIAIGPFAFAHAFGPTTITLPKTALLGAVVGLMARKPTIGFFRRGAPRLILVSCLAVALATLLSVAVADYRWPAIRETLKALEYVTLFVFAAAAYFADPDATAVVRGCVATAGVVSALAIAQEFVGSPTALMVAGHAVTRIAGPLEGPNQLAGFLGLLLPILIVQSAANRRSTGYYLFLAVAMIADFLTFSRAGVASGLAGSIAALLAYDVGNVRLWLGVLLVPVALGLGSVMISGGSIGRFFSNGSQLGIEGLGTRQQLWTAAMDLWRSHPFLGIGADNYEFELARAGYPELHTHPNSQFLQALVEQGIPGIAAFTWATLQPLWSLWSLRKEPLVAGIWGACLALGLHQIFDSMSFFPKVGGLAWLLVGVGVALVARGAIARYV